LGGAETAKAFKMRRESSFDPVGVFFPQRFG
jgi:hypothetical protein